MIFTSFNQLSFTHPLRCHIQQEPSRAYQRLWPPACIYVADEDIAFPSGLGERATHQRTGNWTVFRRGSERR